jgi:hypothetical protein
MTFKNKLRVLQLFLILGKSINRLIMAKRKKPDEFKKIIPFLTKTRYRHMKINDWKGKKD